MPQRGVRRRDGSLTAPGGPTTVPAEESRSEIDEQPIPKLGGPTYKQVKPKTYQVLEEQLQQSSEDTSAPAAAGIGLYANSRTRCALCRPITITLSALSSPSVSSFSFLPFPLHSRILPYIPPLTIPSPTKKTFVV